jgi:DNA (cytosine-5)-methyltransferase 1
MLKFIDLFAGIGGFHLAFHNAGAECVFASEIDKSARETYQKNLEKISPKVFKKNKSNINYFNDDIRSIDPVDIPDHDILCAGFPCQPFSQAGYKKGFEETKDDRGNMFFILRDIIKEKRPKCIFLENVRHLLKHDNGRTFQIIMEILSDELNYDIYYKIVKASDYGLPQHRPRIFIIGFRKEDNNSWSFDFPKPKPLKFTMSDVWGGECDRDIGFTLRVGGGGSSIDDRRNWDSYRVDGEVKRLGPTQGKKMMGFPDWYELPTSRTQAMKQLGNSVAVDAVHEVAKSIVSYLHGKPANKNPKPTRQNPGKNKFNA